MKQGKVVMTGKRKQFISKMQDLGDRVEANGNGYLSPEEVEARLGMPCNSMFLNALKRDGILDKIVNGRRLKAFWLTEGYAAHKKVKRKYEKSGKYSKKPGTDIEVVDRAPARRRRGATLEIPPPPLLGKVEVFMQMVDRDGQLHVGFRDDTCSWISTVNGMQVEIEP